MFYLTSGHNHNESNMGVVDAKSTSLAVLRRLQAGKKGGLILAARGGAPYLKINQVVPYTSVVMSD